MLTERELEKAIATITDRLDGVNRFFIRKIAAQIKQIGELGPTNVNRIVTMVDMGRDILEITTKLQEATGLNTQALFAIYQAAVDDVYTDKRFAAALKADADGTQAQAAKERLTQYAQNVAVQSAQTMINLSNTTAVSDTYRQAIDKAVLAVSSGMMDYREATRQVVRELGYNGLQVRYASGYHRRLDTAVRQNIVDATNQIAQHGSDLMGETLGFDAVEISAHANSAPDHEPVQGRVFLRSEFDKMQAGQDCYDVDGVHYEGFSRPIGEWNCMHIAMAFSTKYSVRRFTPEQLNAMAAQNAAGCEFNGKQYTKYQADQMMRKIETDVRRWKDAANAARLNGDDMTERRNCQRKINALVAKYKRLSDASGLPQRKDRMTVEGFKMVKV
jgi:hypothetical protein